MYIYAYVYIHIHMNIHISTCTHIYIYIYECTEIHMHACWLPAIRTMAHMGIPRFYPGTSTAGASLPTVAQAKEAPIRSLHALPSLMPRTVGDHLEDCPSNLYYGPFRVHS